MKYFVYRNYTNAPVGWAEVTESVYRCYLTLDNTRVACIDQS